MPTAHQAHGRREADELRQAEKGDRVRDRPSDRPRHLCGVGFGHRRGQAIRSLG